MQLKVNYYKIKYLKKKTNFRKKLLPEDNGNLPEEASSGNIPDDVLPKVVCEYFRKTQILLPEEGSSGKVPEIIFPEKELLKDNFATSLFAGCPSNNAGCTSNSLAGFIFGLNYFILREIKRSTQF